MSALWLSLTLGLVAGLADYLGGFLLVRQSPSARALRYFVALGAGFMLAAAVLEMIPEGLQGLPPKESRTSTLTEAPMKLGGKSTVTDTSPRRVGTM